jgi:proliferating cell nuclear antigen
MDKIVIRAAAFDKILNDIQVMSDNISIETIAGKKAVTFSGVSDNGNATVTIDYDDDKNNTENPVLQELAVKEDSKCTYNIDYISKIVKALGPVSGAITIEYSSKKPLKLQFVLLNALKVQFFLAPRVDN